MKVLWACGLDAGSQKCFRRACAPHSTHCECWQRQEESHLASNPAVKGVCTALKAPEAFAVAFNLL